ncbi:TetR/AcrR family transcriptional regulator [Paenibacillus sp. GCM10027627]|uniref:TetR/AcrR family transcriptional regulator n=1 Tax=unclassified Paenibacillus TaxID=185978 RepID=UPI00363FA9B7
MPKIVDHEKQRQLVAEAALRVIQKGGLDQATVRNIAEEAGLSVGSMRHYFSSQAELFGFCMRLFLNRINKRVEAMNYDGPLLDVLKHFILQFMPVDEERRLEMEVWFSYNIKVLLHPGLKPLSDEMYDGLFRAAQFVVDMLDRRGLTKSGLNLVMETEKLFALIDGLALHHILRPADVTAASIEEIIAQHLKELCDPSKL